MTGNLYISIKNFCFKEVTSLLFAVFCLLIFSSSVKAQGVLAGTSIDNIATVSYEIGGTAQTPIESSPSGNNVGGTGQGNATQFIVDRKVDLLLTGNSNANVNPGDSQVEVTFTLNNEGNAIQEFSLLPDYTLSGDNFDVSNCNVEVTGVTGTPLTGVTLPTSGNIKLSPDQQASISVKCDIPANNSGSPINSGDTSLISLLATAENNEDGSPTVETTSGDSAMGIETVFADDAGVDDVNRDAMHSARRTYTASTGTAVPTLTMDKSIVSVVDSSGGNTAVAGSEVTYLLQIDTNGVGIINDLIITDPTPTDMTYKAGSIRLNNIAMTDSNDTDNTDFGITNPDTVTINLGDISAGSQYEIQLTYIIN